MKSGSYRPQKKVTPLQCQLPQPGIAEMAENEMDREGLGNRPAILVVGCPNVGKRTLLSRLLSVDFEDASDLSFGLFAQGWTINTKYYTAEVSVWVSHLHDGFDIESLPNVEKIAALVMVYDSSDISTLLALKEWVQRTNIQNFDILLCIGNKVDLLLDHRAHVEYRKRLEEESQSLLRSDADVTHCGIHDTEGNSISRNIEHESPWEVKRASLEWFTERNIEFIEACASNAEFDKCLSVDGDSQGIERVYGALSAHMWPGMVLKSGDKIAHPLLPERQELSSEGESDYEQEYEILSAGDSADVWDDMEYGWVSAPDPTDSHNTTTTLESSEVGESSAKPQTEVAATATTTTGGEVYGGDEAEEEKGVHYELEDLEQLMSEIGNMRENLRLMPDFQRREMAASLALKMASMFGDSECEEITE